MKGKNKSMSKNALIRKHIGRYSKKPDYELLLMMLEKHTSAEIGNMFGVSSSTVRSWVYRDKRRDRQ